MKKALCLFVFVVIIFSLVSCSANSNTQETQLIIEETKTVENANPTPKETTWEKSDNSLGAIYSFTLDELCIKLNEALKKTGDDKEIFDINKWSILSEGLEDDKEVKYDTYFFATNTIVYTAAVETKSKKVMNVGCGCPKEKFLDSKKDYQYSTLIMTSLLATVVGGYDVDDMNFMFNMLIELMKSDSAFFYNNGIYSLSYDEKDVNENSILFMLSPADESIIKEWDLINYATYKSQK